VDEDTPQLPSTVYAATKCAQELLALQQWRASGLQTVVTRSFNHSGPGQESRFLLPALVTRALSLRGSREKNTLRLGNLTPVRDFLHVADVVQAYISLCERGSAGEAFNVASGVGRSVAEIAECVLERVGVTAELVEDPALVRPIEVPSLVGDSSKLQRAVNWRATKSFDDLIDDLLHAATH
jgi:GDP-4-dehydro-6-deoxy-D-mannose reductase